ncbi:MAG: ABC transporter permease [Myxococcales bacterium]|nr:ABC transporter permease [Myxococcales bacterium]
MLPLPRGYRLVFEPVLDRDGSGRWRLLRSLASLGAAFAVAALVLTAAGVDAGLAYRQIFTASFADVPALSDTLVRATPLALCALGSALAFRARLWNIGGEGQLLVGAWAAVGVVLHGLPASTPRPILLIAMLFCAAVASALWAGLCALLRLWLGVSELLSSLMLNYIALLGLRSFVFGPWSEGGFGLTPQLPRSAWLPRLSDLAERVPACRGLTVHLGFVLAVLCVVFFGLVLSRSRFGYRLRVLGANPQAARAAGLPVERDILWALLLSGACAGLAGFCEVSGVVHRLSDRFSTGYGFTALIVAWLAGLQPRWILPAAILFGGLLVGGQELQPGGIPLLLQGVVLMAVLASEALLRSRPRLLRPEAGSSDEPSGASAAATAAQKSDHSEDLP